jgi:hypothetical protein
VSRDVRNVSSTPLMEFSFKMLHHNGGSVVYLQGLC